MEKPGLALERVKYHPKSWKHCTLSIPLSKSRFAPACNLQSMLLPDNF